MKVIRLCERGLCMNDATKSAQSRRLAGSRLFFCEACLVVYLNGEKPESLGVAPVVAETVS